MLEDERYTLEQFNESLYRDMPMGNGKVLKSTFSFLDEKQTIAFSPMHISSMEVIEE